MSCDANSIPAAVCFSLNFGFADRRWVSHWLIPRTMLQMGRYGLYVICVCLLSPSGLPENSSVFAINVELLLYGV